MRKSLTYINSKYNFSVDYPADWDVREDLDGIVVVFAGPSVLKGIYDVNINVTAERLPEKMTLKDYVMEADMKAIKTIPDYKKKHADWFLNPEEAKKHNLANQLRIPTLRISIDVNIDFE